MGGKVVLLGTDRRASLRRWCGGIGFEQLVAELAVRSWLRSSLRSWFNSFLFSSMKRPLLSGALHVFANFDFFSSCSRFVRGGSPLVLLRQQKIQTLRSFFSSVAVSGLPSFFDP